MEKRFVIEFSEKQLDILSRCVEDISRFLAGQMELSNTIDRFINNGADVDKKGAKDLLRLLRRLLHPELEREGGDHGWTGHGAPEPKNEYIAETYQIYRTLYYFLTKAKTWSNEANVYNSPALTLKGHEQPYLVNEITMLDTNESWFNGEVFVYNNKGAYDLDPINDMISGGNMERLKETVKNGYGYSVYTNKNGTFDVVITRYGWEHKKGTFNTKNDAVMFIINQAYSKDEDY